jgi:hypothetical protein
MRPAFTILMLSVFLVVTQHIAAGACGNLAKGGATQPTRKGIVAFGLYHNAQPTRRAACEE